MKLKTNTTEEETFSTSDVSNKNSKKSLFLGIVFLLMILGTLYFYNESKNLEKNPNKVNEEKVLKTVRRVEKLIDLPTGEFPTLAKISDTKELANNPFFEKAKVGDEVLFYPGSGKIYLYDPVANMIVDVATINIGDR